MHIAFRKSLANGMVSVTSAGSWDELKYQLSRLDHHDTEEWDAHFAWESFNSGNLIKDSCSIWRYVNFENEDIHDAEVFDGRLIDLSEIDPLFN